MSRSAKASVTKGGRDTRSRATTARRGNKALKVRSPMPQTARTKTEAEMAHRLSTLDPGTLRYRALSVAIDFKQSWFQLARLLAEARKNGDFKEWGYRTFEAYAQHELHLRRETSQKLVRSYDFLSEHEKPLIEALDHSSNSEPVHLPAFQSLEVLAEARKNPHLSDNDYQEIRDQVFGEDPAPSQVRKMIRERAPESGKTVKKDEPAERLRRCLALAERLYGMLLEEEVPERVSRSVEEAVGELRRLVDE